MIKNHRQSLAAIAAAALIGIHTPLLASDVFTLYTTSVSGAIASGAWDFYNDGSTTSGALAADSLGGVGGGTLNFHESSFLQASFGGAVTGGSLTFHDSSFLNAAFADSIQNGDQTFNDNSMLVASVDNAIDGGQQTFNNSASLQVTAGGALKSGVQTFNGISFLSASEGSGVSGGTQAFHENTTLYASVSNAVNGGTQNFDGNSNLYVSASDGVSSGMQDFAGNSHLDAAEISSLIGGTQSFHDSATLYASASEAVNGGLQSFEGTSRLHAFASHAVNGGAQTFADSSHLDAATGDSVSGGTQGFHGSSSLQATATHAVSGGAQSFYDTATLNATVANAVIQTNLTLYQSSKITVNADDALSNGAAITFDASLGGVGGTLFLNGHDIPIGAISSVSGGGIIANTAATAATLTVDFDLTSGTYGGLLQDGGAGLLAFVKAGTGTLTLAGTNTYTGETFVEGGTLVVDGSIAASVRTTIQNGGTLAGHGAIGDVTIEGGGTISAGHAGPGTLATAGQTWEGGGVFAFDINDADGTAGTNWDLLEITGALDITADAAHPFVFKITTLNGSTPGDMANYVPGNRYTWLVASTTNISGFSLTKFTVDATGFQNAGPVYFSLSVVGNNLYLTAVPEPAEWGATMGAALLGFVILRRHRLRFRPIA